MLRSKGKGAASLINYCSSDSDSSSDEDTPEMQLTQGGVKWGAGISAAGIPFVRVNIPSYAGFNDWEELTGTVPTAPNRRLQLDERKFEEKVKYYVPPLPGSDVEWVTVVPGQEAPVLKVAENSRLRPVEGLNPFLMDHVIEGILGWLPAGTVKACRLVCREWNVAAKDFLEKKRGKFLVRSNPYNEGDVVKLQKSLEKDQFFGVGELTIIGFKFISFDEPIARLFTDVAQNLCVLKMFACIVNPDRLGELLNQHTKCLEILHFQSVGFDNSLGDRIYRSWSIVIRNLRLPSLKEFKLVDEHKVDYNGVPLFMPFHGSIRIPMYRMSLAFPNLERLMCKTDVGFDMCLESNVKEYIRRNDQRKCNWRRTLKEVAFHRIDFGTKTLDTSVFEALKVTGVRNLTKVDITPFLDGEQPIRGFRIVMEKIKRFLEQIKDSVKEVRVAVYSDNCPRSALRLLPINMPSLERLSISPAMIGSLGDLPKHQRFKTLEMEDHPVAGGIGYLFGSNAKIDSFGKPIRSNDKEVNPYVEILKLHTLGVSDIRKFSCFFPNIRELELNFVFHDYNHALLDGEKLTYQMLVTCFPLLEKLVMRYPVNFTSRLDPNDHDIVGCGGVWNLQRLRVLDLYPARKLTGISVISGLWKLKNLEYLNLSKSQISSAALEWIGADNERFANLKVLKVEGCTKINAEDCVELSTLRQDLHVIFGEYESELPWCYRSGKERCHKQEICNCDGSPYGRTRPDGYESTCHGAAGARPNGIGFW